MRILHTCLRYPPATGGVETYVKEIVDRTQLRIHDVRVLTSAMRTHGPISKLDPELLLDDPMYIQRLHHASTPFISYPRLQALDYYIGHHQPDIIHSYSFWYQPADVTARYARRQRIPFIFHPMYYENKARQKPIWQLYKHVIGRQTFANADVVVVISPFEQSLIEKAGLPVKRFELIPPGIDTAELNRPTENIFQQKGITGTVLLTVSRLATGKGLADTIEALPELLKSQQGLQLAIVGEDFGARAQLESLATSLGVQNKLHFLGKLSRADLISAYQHADIFIHPSHYEAFGIVVAEALAAGTPVVARNTSAIPYVAPHNRAALLFNNSDELIRHITTLLSNTPVSAQLTDFGTQHIIKNFSWDASIKKILKLYEELTRRAGLASREIGARVVRLERDPARGGTGASEPAPRNKHAKGTRVLLVALSGIGNYLMQSPTIAALKKANPDWHVTVWVAPRGTKALAEADPNVDEIIETPIKNSISGHLVTGYRLLLTGYNIGIILSPGQLIKSAAYLFFAGIPRRIGNTYPFRGKEHSRFLLTDAIPEDPNLHDIEQNLRLLKPLGTKDLIRNTGYEIRIPESNNRQGKEMLNALQIPRDKKIIGLRAGSAPDLAFKRWPIDNFATVATELITEHNAHILLFGGPDEEEQKQHLKQMIESRIQNTKYKIQNTSIISAKLLTVAAIMQRCHIFLSNDSGLMHLAAASGVKTYGLFGPTDETRTGSRGSDSHVIRAPGTKPVYDTEKSFYLGVKPHPTILAITPDLVLSKIKPFIGASHK